MRASRLVSIAITGFLVVLVNLPFASSQWTAWRIDRDGRDVSVAVTDHGYAEGAYVLELTDDRLDATGQPVLVRVGETTYDAAVAAGRTPVRVLEPGRFEVPGQVTSRVPLVFTLAADVVIVALVVLYTRFRGALRPELVLRATGDLEPCEPGSVLERIAGNEYVVAGTLRTADEPGEVLLDLGDRRVRVVLDGHGVAAGPDQPVRATGVMIG